MRFYAVVAGVLLGLVLGAPPSPAVEFTFPLDGLPTAEPLFIGPKKIVACFIRLETNYSQPWIETVDSTTSSAEGQQLGSACYYKPLKTSRNTALYWNRHEVGEFDVDADSWIVWTMPRGNNVHGLVTDRKGELAFVPCGSGANQNLTAVNITDKGSVLWHYTPIPPRSGEVPDIHMPAYHEDRVFFIVGSDLFAFGATLGNLLFTVKTPCGITRPMIAVLEFDALRRLKMLVVSGPTAKGNALCRIHHTTGDVEWTVDQASAQITSIVAGEGIVLFYDTGYHAVNATTGASLFDKSIGFFDEWCGALMRNKVLYLSMNQVLTAISLTPPYNTLWEQPGCNCTAPMRLHQDKLYRVYMDAAYVAAHQVSDGAIAWQLNGVSSMLPVVPHNEYVLVFDSQAKLWGLSANPAPSTPLPAPTPHPANTPAPSPRPTSPPGKRARIKAMFPIDGMGTARPLVLATGEVIASFIDTDFGDAEVEVINFEKMFGSGIVLPAPVTHQPIATGHGTALYFNSRSVGELDPGYGPIWAHQRGRSFRRVAVDNTIAFVPMQGPSAQNLTALSLTNNGDALWSFAIFSRDGMSDPAVHEKLVFIADGSTVYALNQTTGSIMWERTDLCGIHNPFLKVVEHESGLFSLMAFGASAQGSSAEVCRIHHATGVVEWVATFAGEDGALVTEIGAGSGVVWASDARSLQLSVLNASTGDVLFEEPRAKVHDLDCSPYIVAQPLRVPTIVYSSNDVLVARALWSPFSTVWSTTATMCCYEPILVGDELLIVDDGWSITSLDPADGGTLNWVHYFDAGGRPTPGIDSTAVASAGNGDVYAFYVKSTPSPAGAPPSNGVSGGAVAAIIIVLLLAGGAAFGVYTFKVKSRRRSAGEGTHLQGKYDEIPDN